MAQEAMKKETRAKIAKRVYKFADGRESANAGPNCESLSFAWADGTKSDPVTRDTIGDDCAEACFWHGLAAKLADRWSDAKGDITAAKALFDVGLSNLQNNIWLQRGEGNVRVNYLVDAIVNLIERGGETVDDERRASIWQKVATKEQREAALANDAIAAEYKRLEAERAAERAKQLADKAKETGATIEGLNF